MRMARTLGVITLLFVLAAGASPTGQPASVRVEPVDGELLIRYRAASDDARRDAVVRRISGQRLKRFRELNIDHVKLPRGQRAEDALVSLLASGDVVAAQPNYVRTISLPAPPNDPAWTNDVANDFWGMKKIGADVAWGAGNRGSASIVVADIDTGVKYDHPDLAANMWINPGEIAGNGIDDDGNGYVDDVRGIDTFNHDSDPMDDNGHGTHTAGTIGAVGNNGTGVVGVNWTVKILPCKFLSASGSGSDAGAIECFNYITWLKNHGVNIRVSSNSWGGYRDLTQPFPQLLKDAIDAAGTAGIINVFAAGNGGADGIGDNIDTTPHDPASFTSPSIVSVAASDKNDARASFSNFGATAVDIAAPGTHILSTYINVGTCKPCYAYLDGTSMATPHVAGAAALLAAQSGNVPVSGLKALLLSNVTPLAAWSGVVASGGRLNVGTSSAALAANGAPSVSITSPSAGATFTAPATITVNASATDTGAVTKVEFFLGATLIGTDTVAPYTATASNVPAGSYTITARATDDLGAQTTSSGVTVSVVTAAEAAVTQAVSATGTRLQQLQNADGGWYFGVNDTSCGAGVGVSCKNTIGITALGLISTYSRTHDATVLADAVAAGQLLATIHANEPSRAPVSQDLEFLVALSTATGDPQYATLASSWFQAVTTAYPVAADKADEMFTARGAQRLRTLAVWDASSIIRMAKAAGNVAYASALATRVIAREADWKDVTPSHRWDQCASFGCGPADNPLAFDHTLLGIGSLLWAIHDLPGFDTKISEYRAWLVSQQDAEGGWDVGDLQITSYVAMGLGAVGGTGAQAAMSSAVAFLMANQLPTGGFPIWSAGGSVGAEYTEVDSEVIRAIATLANTQAGQVVLVAPSQIATVTFDTVTQPGATTFVALTATGTLPGGYALVPGQTYVVTTTAQTSGTATVCFGSPVTTGVRNARILHLEGTRFVDRTTTGGCATASSLDTFAIAERKANPPRSREHDRRHSPRRRDS